MTGLEMVKVAGIALLAAVIVVALIYNAFIRRRNRVDNVFGTVDVLLKKRCDLIPNLVSTVRGYAQHERAVLEELTALRGRAAGGASPEALGANVQISALMPRLLATVEQYPDLKASGNFMQLQAALAEVEEQISAGRRAYNAAVTSYNNLVQMFPANLFAGMFGFSIRPLFEASAADRAVPSAG